MNSRRFKKNKVLRAGFRKLEEAGYSHYCRDLEALISDEKNVLPATSHVYIGLLDDKGDLQHIKDPNQIREEIQWIKSLTGDGPLPQALREYSQYSQLRAVLKILNKDQLNDISVEYNNVSDVLMEEADAINRSLIGPPPVDYAVVRVGSKGRYGSDLFSDLDIVIVHESTTTEDALYFERYAAKLYHYLQRWNYLVDFVLSIPNAGKDARIQKERAKTGQDPKKPFKLWTSLGNLAASISEIDSYLSQKGESTIIDRTAILDVSHILGSKELTKRLTRVVKEKIYDLGKERFLREIKTKIEEEAEEWDAKQRDSEGIDLKYNPGGLLHLTKIFGIAKVMGGMYGVTHPETVLRRGAEKGIIDTKEARKLYDAYIFLRTLRNRWHLRNTTPEEFVRGKAVDYVEDLSDLARDMELKPVTLSRDYKKHTAHVRKISEKLRNQ